MFCCWKVKIFPRSDETAMGMMKTHTLFGLALVFFAWRFVVLGRMGNDAWDENSSGGKAGLKGSVVGWWSRLMRLVLLPW
jgi:hypothetical protein